MERPDGLGAFEFVTLAALRAAQLMRGCAPKVSGAIKHTTLAQIEIAEGMIARAEDLPPSPGHSGPIT
jgi:DNA-directed RNA polymerase subunit K/omega